MSKGIWLSVTIGFVLAILILPSTPVQAYGPGGTNGTVGSSDTYWTGSWSTVFVHTDTNTDPWTTGLTFENVSYKDVANGDNTFNRYVREITIPWIEIKWVNDNNIYIYPHDDSGGSMNCRLLFNGPWFGGAFNGWTESNNQPNNPSILRATYDLDTNNDGNRDFQFEEIIELHGNGLANHGYITAGIRVLIPNGAPPWQVGNLPNQKTVESIRYVFLMDCDVYDSQNNNFYYWDNVNNQWIQHQNECAGSFAICDAVGRSARFYNQNANRQIAAGVLADGHAAATWFAQQRHGNEYSQWPVNYDNNESLASTNGQFWCYETFNMAMNPPPGPGQAPAGFTFSDFDI